MIARKTALKRPFSFILSSYGSHCIRLAPASRFAQLPLWMLEMMMPVWEPSEDAWMNVSALKAKPTW